MSTALVEPIINEVATNLDEAAAVTRSLNAAAISSFSFGTFVGLGLGFFWGYRYNKKKLYADAMTHADEVIEEEVSKMSEHYRNKTLALEDQKKDPIEKIVEERGYKIETPGPATREELQKDVEFTKEGDRPSRPLSTPVPLISDDNTSNQLWDYRTEHAKREVDNTLPHVIHKDEFNQFHAYTDVSYTYFPLDEILAGEDHMPIENVTDVVGAESLDRFGHGSGDPNVVFVRNNVLQLQIEIVRVPDQSYQEFVRGLHPEPEPGSLIEKENSGIIDDSTSD